MKTLLYRWFLRTEYAFHMVEAYMAYNRGEMAFRADSLSRAYECERKLAVLELNHVK